MKISSGRFRARAFIRNEKGSFAIMTAAVLAALAMAAGFAINLAQLDAPINLAKSVRL